MTRNLEARLAARSPLAVAVFRVVFGLLFLCHGLSKLIGWPVGPSVAVGEWPLYYAGWIETVTSVLITVGLFARPAALIACGVMAYAYFTEHLSLGFFPIANKGEPAVLYCFSFLLLVFIGPGAYALDSRRRPGAGRTRLNRWRGNRRLGFPSRLRRGS